MQPSTAVSLGSLQCTHLLPTLICHQLLFNSVKLLLSLFDTLKEGALPLDRARNRRLVASHWGITLQATSLCCSASWMAD